MDPYDHSHISYIITNMIMTCGVSTENERIRGVSQTSGGVSVSMEEERLEEVGSFGSDVGTHEDCRAGPAVVVGWCPNGPPAVPWKV